MKKFFWILVFLPFLMGVKDPNKPKDPIDQTQKEKNQQQEKTILVKTKVIFVDKNIVFTGIASFTPFKITIVTEKSGFQFFKELEAGQIKSITIRKWKASPFKEGAYAFYPSEYEIVDQKNIAFLYRKNIPELNAFVLETDLGKTKFFSYFIDYLKDGQWDLRKRKANEIETDIALDKVVKTIEFF